MAVTLNGQEQAAAQHEQPAPGTPLPAEAPAGQEAHKATYRRYIDLINAQDFAALPEVVDPERYREICVGFTPGWVALPDAVTSLRRVLTGIPDLNARVDDVVAEGDRVYARLTVTGTNAGRLFGVPPTGQGYEVQMFDYARFDGGRIVERIQQSDTLGQFRQMQTFRATERRSLERAVEGVLLRQHVKRT